MHLRGLVCALSLLAVASTLSLPSAHAEHRRSPARLARARRCRPPHRQVIRRAGAAVLFLRQTGPDDGKYGAPHSLYGCAGSRQAPVDLFDFEDGDTPSVVITAFAGPYAAFFLGWEAATCVFYQSAGAENCGQTLFESVNLRTGRTRVTVEEAAPPATPAALAVTSKGWMAWAVAASPGAMALMAWDSRGQRTLDPGPVEAGSLKINGETVRWSDSGVLRTAALG